MLIHVAVLRKGRGGQKTKDRILYLRLRTWRRMTVLHNLTVILDRLTLFVIRFRKRYVSSQGGILLPIFNFFFSPRLSKNYCSAHRGKAWSQFMIYYAKNLLPLSFTIFSMSTVLHQWCPGQVHQEKTGLSHKAVSLGLHTLESAVLYLSPDKLCLAYTKTAKSLVDFCITVKKI